MTAARPRSCARAANFSALCPVAQGELMGWLAKSATKKRIQPLQGALSEALSAPEPWATNGAIAVAALVRSVLLALDLTGAKPSGLTAALYLPTTTSTMWLSARGSRRWTATLGAGNGTGGVAADWSVDVLVEDRNVVVSTGGYLTRDDALVHGDLHDVLRDELLRSLALAQMPPGEAEEELTQTSLTVPVLFSDSPASPQDVTFAIAVAADPDQSQEILKKVGLRILDSSPTSITWALGLPENDRTDRATLDLTAGRLHGHASIGLSTALGQRVAACGLRTLILRAPFILQSLDRNVAYEGPSEWT